AIYKGSRLRNEISVSAYERSVRVRLPCTVGIRGRARFSNDRSDTDKLVRRISIDAKRVVGRFGISIIRPENESVAETFSEVQDQPVIFTLEERPECSNLSSGIRRVKAAADSRNTRPESKVAQPYAQKIAYFAV